jgi:hypothetical protein
MTYLDDLAAEIRSEVPDAVRLDEDTTDLYLIYAVLLLAKGDGATREDVHNAWAAWKAIRREDHESVRPFDELSDATKDEDSPFVTAIRQVAKRHGMVAQDRS